MPTNFSMIKRGSTKKQFNGKPTKKTVAIQKEEKPLKKSMLINSAVVTVRDPSKSTENLCKNLRKVLSPDCLTKLDINPKMQDLADVAHQLLVKQIIYLSEHVAKVAILPNGPTYVFDIISYEDNFKNFSTEIYKSAPFLTFDGKSPLKQLFQHFGQSEKDSKRVLHFHFKDELVHIRHFMKTTEDTEDNFKVHLREIGPKVTLRFSEKIDGVFPDLKLRLKFKNRFSTDEAED